jgi:hypothetical protein
MQQIPGWPVLGVVVERLALPAHRDDRSQGHFYGLVPSLLEAVFPWALGRWICRMTFVGR